MKLNGIQMDDFSGNVAEFLIYQAIRSEGVAVALNGDVVPRSEWTSTTLPPNCEIEIVTAAAGG